jgi:hypothetical protein
LGAVFRPWMIPTARKEIADRLGDERAPVEGGHDAADLLSLLEPLNSKMTF